MNRMTVRPGAEIRGEYEPPADKSISHRLAMMGALANGASEFSNFLAADDCLRTVQAFKAMGVRFDVSGQTVKVHGVGLHGLTPPKQPLDLGNSGTTMRLLLGILAGQRFETCVTGDDSLRRRPMGRVTKPLRKMGAQIRGEEDGNYAPITIHGGRLTGIHFENKIASAQVKSAVLLAGLYAEGETTVEESMPSRDHTERLLQTFGVSIARSQGTATVSQAQVLRPIQFAVPGDISSASFLLVAALICPNSELIIKNVGLNPTRTGILDVLKAMGANLTVETAAPGSPGSEPAGDIRVKSSRLKATKITKAMIPSLIDELPILMVAFALAEGTSEIAGAAELRVKETDRIRSMLTGLNTLGVKVLEREDGCLIEGLRAFGGGKVSSFGDHRTAMSFAVAGLSAKQEVIVEDTDCVKTSYPGFEDDLSRFSRW